MKIAEAITPRVAFGVLMLVGVAALAWFLEPRRYVAAATRKAIGKHLDALVCRRAQLLTTDAYGKPQSDKWTKEILRFVDGHVAPGLGPFYGKELEKRRATIAQRIEDCVAKAAANSPVLNPLPPDVTPTEFEVFCAERLRQSGWDAQVTKGSGDQGVDVIATRNGVRVVLQCKLYRSATPDHAVGARACARDRAEKARRESAGHASAARDGRAPFGTIKARMGATHFLMKTLPRVAAEMALHVLAYNLTRVMNIVGPARLIAAIQT